jgi:tetratricopeptide (TPR) repeat protein
MENSDPLKNIVYISIPEEFIGTIGDFEINPSILLPVELPPGDTSYQMENLSWEMIVSAMLKILSSSNEDKNIDYYRNFVLAVRPGITEELTEAAIFKAKNQDYDLAEEMFLALVGLAPENSRFQINLALFYEQRAEAYAKIKNSVFQEEYLEKAFDRYVYLLSLDEIPTEVFLNAGHFFFNRKNFDSAIKYLQMYIDNADDPEKISHAKLIITEIESNNLLDTLFKEAFDFIKIGKEDEGIKKIKEFLKNHPDTWNGWFLLGWGHRRLGHYEQGKEAFQKAIDLGGSNSDTLNELAICQMETGFYVESRKSLESALGMEPDNTKIMSNLGILALKEEKHDEAAGFFKTVLDLEPEDPIALKYLEHIENHL